MTNENSKPVVPQRRQKRECPICGKASYSAAGIHPQCAVRQADDKRREFLKREKVEEKKTAKPAAASRWQKTCPECKLSQHVRKKACVCGHLFAVKSSPSPGDDD